ncbi:MAG TPA: hypothetical protein VGL73_12185 [Caulobacteraceae bacterium]
MRIAALLAGLVLLGAPALAAVPQPGPEQPIPNDGDWRLSRVAGSGCYARLPGPQVDTLLAVNKDGKMVVGAGRSDWKLPNVLEDVTLQVDGGNVYPIKASPVVNVIFGVVPDTVMEDVLRKARQLTWTTPSGRFIADVAGLGIAYDVIRACLR